MTHYYDVSYQDKYGVSGFEADRNMWIGTLDKSKADLIKRAKYYIDDHADRFFFEYLDLLVERLEHAGLNDLRDKVIAKRAWKRLFAEAYDD